MLFNSLEFAIFFPVVVVLKLGSSPLRVSGSDMRLSARDALGLGGRIQVRTEHRAGRAVLSVIDNGYGMSQAFVKESLFRPFQSTKKEGLGIGLFQCRAIVHAHGGGMQVETEIGKGTTLLASFPVNETQ